MKALVILNTILEDEEYEDMECVASGFTKTYLEKAITELEALQQHVKSLEAQLANTEQLTWESCIKTKRCVNCKYCKLNDGSGRYECDNDEALWNVGSVFEDTFGCIYHEQKDTQ